MYRVFCNNRVLQASNFCDELLTGYDSEGDVKSENVDNLIVTIRNWLADESKGDLIFDEVDARDFRRAMECVFRAAPAAGGLVLIDNQIVAIERHGIPDLPKGHIEKGESPENAAIREVTEETGISDLKIIKQLPTTWHCYLLDNQWTIKQTFWYLMETASELHFLPQQEEGISKVYFLNKDNVKHFIENTFASIRENLGEEISRLLLAPTDGAD